MALLDSKPDSETLRAWLQGPLRQQADQDLAWGSSLEISYDIHPNPILIIQAPIFSGSNQDLGIRAYSG